MAYAQALELSVYQQNGFDDREDYLNSLREEYGEIVDVLITVLPPSEDFDGLLSSLEDAIDSGYYDD